MDTHIDNLKRLLENVRSVGFWERLFGWRRIKDQLIDANGDLERLLANYGNEKGRADLASQNVLGLTKDLAISRDEGIKKQSGIDTLLSKTGVDAIKILSLTTELSSVTTSLKNEQESRKRQHDEQMATLRQYQDRIQADRDQEVKERHTTEVKRLENLKDTWIHHQDYVKQTVKTLCSRHTIDYVEKVAFKGDPDNTVSIGGEFIVFDAKSPRGEDLSNFPTYIREQAEKAKKYANVGNVKKWIFFVVPLNTLQVVKTFVYHLADYQVFIVTVDALEPILLSLKKIEEYDMAEQLSPEDRENICRILGKFAHLSKRRVQVDAYFISQFMELAYKCESDLPHDVLEKAIEFERAEKLNPPQEKRAKAIPMVDLEKTLTKIQNDAANKGISLDNSRLTSGLNEVPLYTPA